MNQTVEQLPTLKWKPQLAFADYFYTDTNSILTNGTVFREDIDYFIAYGGRGSAKTYTFLDAVIVEASIRPIRVLCAREIQGSIEESIKAELEAAIEARGLQEFFRITKQAIVGLNGSRFMFKGLRDNIKKLKSISDVDILLCEEADTIIKNSWEKLLPSIRPRKPFGKRGKHPINIIIFNPEDRLDDTYQRFVETPPPRSILKLINWRDNKYFPEHLNDQRLHSLQTRPLKDHEHDWEGKPKSQSDNVIIERSWIRAARFASSNKDFVHCGQRKVAYDPAGQGRDSNANTYANGNVIKSIDEWVKSDDLREASERAFNVAIEEDAESFIFDSCGGFGDGVSVFIEDRKKEAEQEIGKIDMNIFPFDAGSAVVNPDEEIPGTDKSWKEQYSNAKAQTHAITAQKLYNTYRFIILGERDINPADMWSIDIEDDILFKKVIIELSTPIWVKSLTNSKKKVEDKKAMFKRTGLPSPNVADSIHMLSAPQEELKIAGTVF